MIKIVPTQSVVNFWNLLLQKDVQADSISRVRNGLEKFMGSRSLSGY